MATPTNTVTTAEMQKSLDIEFVNKFLGEYQRLAELLGLFDVEVHRAGAVINQYRVTGSLNNSQDADKGASSGTSYVEGDLVALSKYELSKTAVGEVSVIPYRKVTTADAILKAGYEKAVLRTDAKMQGDVRKAVISDFFNFLANGTTTASGATLQPALAQADAVLQDKLETNGDTAERIIHFVNRQDIATYLGSANVTTQTIFGMTYLENFLGVNDIFTTNNVASGTIYSTPVENIRVYGLDFSELNTAGLAYTSDSDGLIGVAHAPVYDHVSAETDVIKGVTFVPEITDYIVKTTIGA